MIEEEEERKGQISLRDFLNCQVCKKIPIDPLRMQCCDFLVCRSGCSDQKFCVKCKQPNKTTSSPFVKELFESIEMKCQNNCGEMIRLSEMGPHDERCPKNNTHCKYCRKTLPLRLAIGHMLQAHAEESSRLILGMHQEKGGLHPNLSKESIGAAYASPLNEAKPFMHFQKPRGNRSAKLTDFGRYICGNTKINRSPFSSEEQQKCSKKGGSCNSCMQLDIVRLGLSKGQLLNLEGRLCSFNKSNETTNCGRIFVRDSTLMFGKTEAVVCQGFTSCQDCRPITVLIKQFSLYFDFI